MSTILLPFAISDGDPESAGPVMANFQAITSVVNGALELGANVVASTAVSQTGATSAEGASSSAARADHKHAIQGFEQLTADPTTSNFVTRIYANTSTGKIRQCISASGSGTYITIGNMAAADLPNHAANHTGGGSDALNPPMCVATRTSNQVISTATNTAIQWNASDLLDTDTMHDSSSNTTRITFTHGGVYHVWGTAQFASNNAGNRRAAITKNGGTNALDSFVDAAPQAGDTSAVKVATIQKFSAADYVEFIVFQSTGGNLNILGTSAGAMIGLNSSCFFAATWVGTGS